MAKSSTEILTGIIVDETLTYDLQEVSYTCNVSVEVIQEMMEYGLIEPKKNISNQPHFNPDAVRRLKIALRLQRDLGVNLPGAALALDLLTELQELRTSLAILEKR